MITITINNQSSRVLAAEVVNTLTFDTIDTANDVLAEYNLKISEIKRILNDKNQLVEQIVTVSDT